MARARKKNGPFDFFTKKRETYHRDVAKERRDLRAHALEERRAKLAAKKQEAAERSHREREEAAELKREEMVEQKRKMERKRADEVDRQIEREMREAGYRNPNPAKSAEQYRLAQAVLSGSNFETGMSKKAAREIVDRTPAKLRSLFSKRNPEDAAGALAEAFLGRPAKTATEFRKTIHYHSVLTGLAPLMEIKVWVDDRHVRAIKFDRERTWLGSAESGEQLYVEGDDLKIEVADFGITGHAAQNYLILIGDVYYVTYFTAKEHLGKQDLIPGPYEHIFSEHGEEEPELLYDRLNEEPQFAGGEYHIPIDIDGKYSSGINN